VGSDAAVAGCHARDEAVAKLLVDKGAELESKDR
jgi:hypothetical protein